MSRLYRMCIEELKEEKNELVNEYFYWLSRPDWFKDKLDKDRLKSEKGNGCRYTKADDRKIIELYRSGKTNKEIAEYMGRSKNGIAHRLTRINYGIGK